MMKIEDLKPGMKIVCAHKLYGSFHPFREGQILTFKRFDESSELKQHIIIEEKIEGFEEASYGWSFKRFERYCQSCSNYEICIHK